MAGTEEPESALKAQLGENINRIIDKRGLNQREVSEILDIPQSNVSNLRHNRLVNVSLERLLSFMVKLQYDVTISFKPKPRLRQEAKITIQKVE